MDISFHYFAVKVLAIKAGFDEADAQTIATFSQYIDDYNAYAYRSYSDIPLHLKNQDVYDVYLSSSHDNFNPPTTGFVDARDMVSLLLENSQKYTVMPFHFVPSSVDALRRKCLTVEETTIDDNNFINVQLEAAKGEYIFAADDQTSTDALIRIGMLLHIFADTCAHQNFSGILTRANEMCLTKVIDNISGDDKTNEYHGIQNTAQKYFKKKFGGAVLDIGHGMVGHVPDLTHVTWEMKLPNGEKYCRNNTEAFLEMARYIFVFLRRCLQELGDVDDEWQAIEPHMRSAFLFDLHKVPSKAVFEKLKAHWTKPEIFPDMTFQYRAEDVFPNALSLNYSEIAMNSPQFYTFVEHVENYLIALYGNRPRKNSWILNPYFEFDYNPENPSVVSSDVGMPVNHAVRFNGDSKLERYIKFNNEGCVHSIGLAKNGLEPEKPDDEPEDEMQSEAEGENVYYEYVLTVDAEGPKGAMSGSGYLRFTDATGDRYKLSIFSSERTNHTLKYNSKDPAIVRIEWSNTSF